MSNTELSCEGIELILEKLNKVNCMPKFNSIGDEKENITLNNNFTSFVNSLEINKFTQIFDYNEWLQENNIDVSNIDEVVKRLETSNLSDTQKLITALIRLERFTPGLLNNLYNNNCFSIFAKKLEGFKNTLE